MSDKLNDTHNVLGSVDDLLLIKEDGEQDGDVKAALLSEFEMTYEGKFEQFLGIRSDFDRRKLTFCLSQSKAIQDLLKFL